MSEQKVTFRVKVCPRCARRIFSRPQVTHCTWCRTRLRWAVVTMTDEEVEDHG